MTHPNSLIQSLLYQDRYSCFNVGIMAYIHYVTNNQTIQPRNVYENLTSSGKIITLANILDIPILKRLYLFAHITSSGSEESLQLLIQPLKITLITCEQNAQPNTKERTKYAVSSHDTTSRGPEYHLKLDFYFPTMSSQKSNSQL